MFVGLLAAISCHAGLLDFIYLSISSLGSQGPFALLLPLIVPVGLLATISCHAAPLDLISFFFSSLGFYGHLLLFCFSILFFFIFAYYWAFLLLGPFLYIKNGYQQLSKVNTSNFGFFFFFFLHRIKQMSDVRELGFFKISEKTKLNW